MANRTTTSEVKEIAEFDNVSDSQVSSFIDDANDIVTHRVEGNVEKDLLPKIEKWLAAHLAMMRERNTEEEGVGQSDMVYAGDTGLGLKFTRYGQQVLMFVPEQVITGAPGGHYTTSTHSSSDQKSLEEGDENWGGAH